MKHNKHTFSGLKQLADAVVAMFGRSCEVAIHDLDNLDRSLIYLAGDVTARKPGGPATDLLLKMLNKKPDSIKDMYNYKTTTRDGRSIKSTTVFLKNESGEIFAAFCINLDTTDFFNATQAMNALINTLSTQEDDIRETFALSAGETIESLFDECLVEIGKQPATMNTGERINLVNLLEQKGIFYMKGAVNRVAELSGVSKYTIYNYLKLIRAQTSSYTGGTNEKSYSNK